MKITLKINNEDKTFTAPFVSARKLRKTLEVSEKVNKHGFNIEIFDEIVKFLVDLYGGQFTGDELMDGIEGNRLFEKALEDMNYIIDGFGEEVKN